MTTQLRSRSYQPDLVHMLRVFSECSKPVIIKHDAYFLHDEGKELYIQVASQASVQSGDRVLTVDDNDDDNPCIKVDLVIHNYPHDDSDWGPSTIRLAKGSLVDPGQCFKILNPEVLE